MSERTERTTTTVRYKNVFAPEDKSIPYRLVGSYEYPKALQMFDRLVAISTAEQIKVYDKMLEERPEFTFFNGINSAFEAAPNLKSANDEQRRRFDDQFKKKGLAWMTALARIELAATASIYGKEKRPFQMFPTAFDLRPYLEILSDDVVAHMKSLAKEDNFKQVLRRSHDSDSMTLAYLRRIKLIKDMLAALLETENPEIESRISPLAKELSKHEKRLVTKVLAESMDVASTSSRTSRVERSGRTSGAECQAFVSRLGTGSTEPSGTGR